MPDPGALERPRLVRDAQPRYPAAAFAAQREADVVVLLSLDTSGAVEDVALVASAGHGFDEEALRAARALRFTPARVGGVATAIQIRYTFRFRIPEKETVAREPLPACQDACPTDERPHARLRATVYERGRGKILPGVEVYVLDEDRVVLTDKNGQFELDGPPGAYALVIRPPGFYPFETVERLEPGEDVTLKYYVRRHRRARYSTIVWGSEGRGQVARTSLVDDEIRSIPGTLGDPIRVAMLLPGVSSSASGLGYPIVRGSLPGDSMYEIDGIPVPMLYHLLLGSAVVHPRFVDEITFQPGGAPAEHGRFPGGRIAATTARVDDDPVSVAHLSLIDTSLYRAQRVGESSELVAAARYGTLGYLIEGLSANTVFRYWDYQTRLAHRFQSGGILSLTVLGAEDAAGEVDKDTGEETVLRMGFHTADLRYRQGIGRSWLSAGLQGSHERFLPPMDTGEDAADDAGSARLWSLRPYGKIGHSFAGGLEVTVGGDLFLQNFGLDLTSDEDVLFTPDSGVTAGAFATAEWQLGDLLVAPGVRVDHYRYRYPTPGASDIETSLDPRLAVSYELAGKRLRLAASAGRHSGPSRFSFVEPPLVFGPIPGYEGPGIHWGLSHTWQFQAGATARLPGDLELAVTGFYHMLDQPIDFSLIDKPLEPGIDDCITGDATANPTRALDVGGRSYGAELLLRRRLGNAVFGWLSYAVSRSERDVRDVGTLPFDFDQTHVLNAVLSWEVGRNWTVGAVFHGNTGRPYTPLVVTRCTLDDFTFFAGRTGEPNSARFPFYWRVDARIQKREVFDTWYFDFYIDFFNAAFQWETVGYDIDPGTGELEPETVPLFLPMIGIRGEF